MIIVYLLGKMMSMVWRVVVNWREYIQVVLQAIWDLLLNCASALGNAIMAVLKFVWQVIWLIIEPIFEMLLKLLELLNLLWGMVKSVATWLGRQSLALLEALAAGLQTIITVLCDFVQQELRIGIMESCMGSDVWYLPSGIESRGLDLSILLRRGPCHVEFRL